MGPGGKKPKGPRRPPYAKPLQPVVDNVLEQIPPNLLTPVFDDVLEADLGL